MTLYWDYINTGKHKFQFTQGNTTHHVFPLKTHQRLSPSPPNLSSNPPTPTPPHVGAKSPHTFSGLVFTWHKVPFSDIVALPYSDSSWSTGWERLIFSQQVIDLTTAYNINNQIQGAKVIGPYPYNDPFSLAVLPSWTGLAQARF